MIENKLIVYLSKLSFDDLQEAKKLIEFMLKEKGKKDDNRSSGDRFKAKISGGCIIEREREFYNKEHDINIIDISYNGIKFSSSADIIKGDLLNVFFRLPFKGNMKDIYVRVMRVKKVVISGKNFFEIGAKSINYKEVLAYRRSLAKGTASKD